MKWGLTNECFEDEKRNNPVYTLKKVMEELDFSG